MSLPGDALPGTQADYRPAVGSQLDCREGTSDGRRNKDASQQQGMMNHQPHHFRTSSVASLITGQLGHFWKADPGQFSKAPKHFGLGTESYAKSIEISWPSGIRQETSRISNGFPVAGRKPKVSDWTYAGDSIRLCIQRYSARGTKPDFAISLS